MMVCWTFFGWCVPGVCAPGRLRTQNLVSVGGYFSSRAYASMGGADKRKTAFLTAIVLPM